MRGVQRPQSGRRRLEGYFHPPSPRPSPRGTGERGELPTPFQDERQRRFSSAQPCPLLRQDRRSASRSRQVECREGHLLNGRIPRAKLPEGDTLRDLAIAYLRQQKASMDNGELSSRTFQDNHHTCASLIEHFGNTACLTTTSAKKHFGGLPRRSVQAIRPRLSRQRDPEGEERFQIRPRIRDGQDARFVRTRFQKTLEKNAPP